MIAFDFEYYRPETLGEATALFAQLDSAGKNPVWFGGGSELISMARLGNATFGAVIDIKGIPELKVLEADGDCLVLGVALTLSELMTSKRFPLLEKTVGRIADRTNQNRITLGGNLAGTIIYREAVLPFLLADAELVTAGVGGLKRYAIPAVFNERLTLPRGELLVQASVPLEIAAAPFFHQKKTRNEKIDYPLLTAAAVAVGGRLRIAFSGLAAYPLRDKGAEDILNGYSDNDETRADAFVRALSGVTRDDLSGSAAYRLFVLKDTVINILTAAREAKLLCLR